MSYIKRKSVTVTTDASGDGTGYIEGVNGLINSIEYSKVDFANGVDFTVTNNRSGEQIWAESDVNASAIRRPRGGPCTKGSGPPGTVGASPGRGTPPAGPGAPG